MLFDLNDIFYTQRKLDDTIYKNSGVTYKQVKGKVKLALIVELAELANEIRCFKYWSKKPASEKSVILEEYVDGIHFFSTIAYHFNINPVMKIRNKKFTDDKDVLTKKINKIFFQVRFMNCRLHFKFMFKKYLQLGMLLGFSFDDIKAAYFAKNKINHERQENNY